MSNKDRFLPVILIAIFSIGCLGMTLFMPFAEYGLLTASGEVSPFGEQLSGTLGLTSLLHGISQFVSQTFPDLKNDTNAPYYIYGFFCALAMVSAAIGISVIGREDAEEKTVIPTK